MNQQNGAGFGYYRMGSVETGLLEALDEEFSKGHINTYITGMAPGYFQDTVAVLQKIRKRGGRVWVGIAETVFVFTRPVQIVEGWKDHLKTMMDTLASEGLLDTMLGFYFDEPMLCGIRKEDFRDVTRHLRETWPGLRVFAIFATTAISPDVWSSGDDHPLDPETTRYLTDAGYDMYWDVRDGGIEPYKKVNADLKKRLGREDVHIWYVPCIMSYHGASDEAYALAHLEAMYQFLREESHPGGLMCYAYDIADHDGEVENIGYRELRDRKEDAWTTLEERLLQIGREIVNG